MSFRRSASETRRTNRNGSNDNGALGGSLVIQTSCLPLPPGVSNLPLCSKALIFRLLPAQLTAVSASAAVKWQWVKLSHCASVRIEVPRKPRPGDAHRIERLVQEGIPGKYPQYRSDIYDSPARAETVDFYLPWCHVSLHQIAQYGDG